MKPLLAVACLVASCGLFFPLGPAAAAELPDLVVPDGLGVNIHFTDPRPGEMEMLTQAGFRWVRMDFHWSAMEREKGVYDFSQWDRLVAVLEKHSLRAVFVLDYGNPLYDAGKPPAADEARAAFARWAAAGVKHFIGRGIVWEIWNEPNYSLFWGPKPDVGQYVRLATAVGKAIREAAPHEIVVGPATSRVDFVFLEACFQGGLLEYFDGVTVHPYRALGPETVAKDYEQLRQLIAKYAPKGKKIPILAGEWGYSSAWRATDETKQGKVLPREFLTNLLHGVPLSIWYDWHDDGQDPQEFEHHFGTVYFEYTAGKSPVYRPKPAYLAAQTLTRQLGGYRLKERLAVGEADDYVLALVNDKKDVRWVAWTTTATPHTINIVLPAGKYSVVGHTGEALPNLTADPNGLSVSLTDAPSYLAAEPSNKR